MHQYFLAPDQSSLCFSVSGKGVPVVFVHGFPFDQTTWTPQLLALEDHCRVITLDLRGFGKSEPGALPLSMELFANDLAGLLDALELNDAVFCGLSMGGYILMDLVKRMPERVRGLVFCDTQCEPDTPEAKQKRMDSIELILKGGRAEFTSTFLSKLFAKATYADQSQIVSFINAVINRTSEVSIMNTLLALADRKDSCESLRNVTVPTLVIAGEEDVITTPEKARRIAEHIPGAQLNIIPGAGHLSNLEQPQEFNTALIRFLAAFH